MEKYASRNDGQDFVKLYAKAINEHDPGLAFKVLSNSPTDDKQRASLVQIIATGNNPEVAASTLRFDLLINADQRRQLVGIVSHSGSPLDALDALRSNNSLTSQERCVLLTVINNGNDQWAKDVAEKLDNNDQDEKPNTESGALSGDQ
jgi:hypothetical protein